MICLAVTFFHTTPPAVKAGAPGIQGEQLFGRMDTTSNAGGFSCARIVGAYIPTAMSSTANILVTTSNNVVQPAPLRTMRSLMLSLDSLHLDIHRCSLCTP